MAFAKYKGIKIIMKYNMLAKANSYRQDLVISSERFQHLAESSNQTTQSLMESVTHVLANIASSAEENKPMELMNINNIAHFLAGVEWITKALPISTDETKKQNTIRVLASAAVMPDGTPNMAIIPIVQAGAKHPDIAKKYTDMLLSYTNSQKSGQVNSQQLVQSIKSLQQKIDAVMRVALNAQSQ